jgi:hypothetical protein
MQQSGLILLKRRNISEQIMFLAHIFKMNGLMMTINPLIEVDMKVSGNMLLKVKLTRK